MSIKERESKQFSLEWIPKGSPGLHPVKARRQRSVCKLMLTVFFDCDGAVLVDFLTLGDTVDTDHYLLVLNRLKDRIRMKRPHLWMKPDPDQPERNFIIHHNNAPSHTSARTLSFFLDIPVLPQRRMVLIFKADTSLLTPPSMELRHSLNLQKLRKRLIPRIDRLVAFLFEYFMFIHCILLFIFDGCMIFRLHVLNKV